MRARFPAAPALLVVLALLGPGAAAGQADAPALPDTSPAARGGNIGAALPPGDGAAPVVLGGDTVLWVRAPLGSFTPAERAAAIRRRLVELSGDPYLRLDSVRVRREAAETDVLVDGRVVLAVTDADAAAAGVGRDSLARENARRVAAALRERSGWARVRAIGTGVLFALLTTVAVLLTLRLVRFLFRRALEGVDAGRSTWVLPVRVQKLEFLSADQVADASLAILRTVRMLVLAVLLYTAIPLILSFFPWTRRYADQLFGYVLTPFATVWRSLLAFLPNLFTIGAIVLVTWYLLKLVRMVFVGLARGSVAIPGFYPEWAFPTYKLVRFLVIVFAFVAAWPYLPGSGSPAFQGVGVFLGLLISLGSASAIGNVVGGVVLTYMRPFRVGDRVQIADTLGDVVERTLLVTRVRTTKNVEVTVPNAMVLSSHIVNYSASAKSRGLVLHSTVTIGYDVPWRQVHDLLLSAARGVEGILAEPAPFVLQTSLDDFFVSYEVNAFTDQPQRMAVLYSELHAAIQDRFNAAGVEILSPHYRAARDGQHSTVPAQFLPEGYEPPAVRVEMTGARFARGGTREARGA